MRAKRYFTYEERLAEDTRREQAKAQLRAAEQVKATHLADLALYEELLRQGLATLTVRDKAFTLRLTRAGRLALDQP